MSEGISFRRASKAARGGDTVALVQLLHDLPGLPYLKWVYRLYGYTPIQEAAYYGQESALALLIKKGFKVNDVDRSGASAMIHAAVSGKANVIHLLLSKGARIQDANRYGWTALMVATANGHLSTIEALLSDDSVFWSVQALENQIDLNGRGLLHIAAAFNRPALVKLWLSKDLDPSPQDNQGCTPLFLAYEGKHRACIELLEISSNSKEDDDNVANTNKSKEKNNAIEVDDTATLLALLLETGVYGPRNKEDDEPKAEAEQQQKNQKLQSLQDIFLAAKEGDVSTLTHLLGDQATSLPTTPCWAGRRTPLMEAAYYGQEDAASLLIHKGFNVNSVDEYGSTALFHAAVAGHTSLITLLLDHGATSQDLNTYALSPLMVAVTNGHTSAVEALLADRNVEWNAATLRRQFDLLGRGLLHLAAAYGHVDILKLLLSKGKGLNLGTKDVLGRTAVDAARSHQHRSCIHLLEKVPPISEDYRKPHPCIRTPTKAAKAPSAQQ